MHQPGCLDSRTRFISNITRPSTAGEFADRCCYRLPRHTHTHTQAYQHESCVDCAKIIAWPRNNLCMQAARREPVRVELWNLAQLRAWRQQLTTTLTIMRGCQVGPKPHCHQRYSREPAPGICACLSAISLPNDVNRGDRMVVDPSKHANHTEHSKNHNPSITFRIPRPPATSVHTANCNARRAHWAFALEDVKRTPAAPNLFSTARTSQESPATHRDGRGRASCFRDLKNSPSTIHCR